MSTSHRPDAASPILRQAGIIRDQMQVIEAAIAPYLVQDDTRPAIADAVLRLVIAADALLELVSPSADAMAPVGAAVGMTPEEAHEIFGNAPTGHKFSGQGEREGLDFYPWMHEKVTRIKRAAIRFAQSWLEDPRSIFLRPEVPLSPKEYLRDSLHLQLAELRHNATKVFDMVFAEDIAVEAPPATQESAPPPAIRPAAAPPSARPRIPSLRPFDGEPELVKIGLASGAWTTDPTAWRAGSFPEITPRMQGALDGSLPPVRVLNVQRAHGADVILESGRADALLWRRWRPVFYDLGDRGYRDPVTARVEAQVADWAVGRPDLEVLAEQDRVELAVTLRVTVAAGTLDTVMQRLSVADVELEALAQANRREYEGALEEFLQDVPRPERRRIHLIDMDHDFEE